MGVNTEQAQDLRSARVKALETRADTQTNPKSGMLQMR